MKKLDNDPLKSAIIFHETNLCPKKRKDFEVWLLR